MWLLRQYKQAWLTFLRLVVFFFLEGSSPNKVEDDSMSGVGSMAVAFADTVPRWETSEYVARDVILRCRKILKENNRWLWGIGHISGCKDGG